MKNLTSKKTFLKLIILIVTISMSIAYATVNSVIIGIRGNAIAKTTDGIYIAAIKEYNNINANINETQIINMYKTTLESLVSLSETDINSEMTYEITIFNNTDFYYKFKGIYYDEEYYDNKNIEIVIDENLKEGDILESKKSVTFKITFKYDDSITDLSNISNKIHSIIDFKFHYIDKILNLSDPLFDNTGMIPVEISEDGTVTTADLTTDWYSYGEKRWANMVLVTENSRDSYLNVENKKVNSSDILAYYVWIPRYSYKIWTVDASTNTSPQKIEIIFENKDTISLGTKVGEYRTMPAFTWDKNNDNKRDSNEELSGIWVGKFETSKDSSHNIGTDMPVILPNANSWISQTVSSQFKTLIKIAGGSLNESTGVVLFSGSSVYGLSNNTNSHMLKNNEWAAITYLSHSNYGINSEIRINNYYKNSTFMTGCGASSNNEATSTVCGISYGKVTNYPQSSTGNISGVFDMSGGAWDRVMANYNNVKGSSGFQTLPEKKYYDLFTLTSLSSCTIEICGGHALFETSEWYGDLSNFISNNNYPWIVRSGGYEDGSSAGAYNFGRNVGQSTKISTMRSALVVE